jgi:hypothetical protein
VRVDAVPGNALFGGSQQSSEWRKSVDIQSKSSCPDQASEVLHPTSTEGSRSSHASNNCDPSLQATTMSDSKTMHHVPSQSMNRMSTSLTRPTYKSCYQAAHPKASYGPAFTSWTRTSSENHSICSDHSKPRDQQEALFFCISPDACTNPTLYWIGRQQASPSRTNSHPLASRSLHMAVSSNVLTYSSNLLREVSCDGSSSDNCVSSASIQGCNQKEAGNLTLSPECVDRISSQEKVQKLVASTQDHLHLLDAITNVDALGPETAVTEVVDTETAKGFTAIIHESEVSRESGSQAGTHDTTMSRSCEVPFSLGTAHGPFQLDMGDILYAPNVVKDPQVVHASSRSYGMEWTCFHGYNQQPQCPQQASSSS